MAGIFYEEHGYVALLGTILDDGVDVKSRAGDCRAIFDAKLKFNLNYGFPAPTNRSVPLRMAFEELWFFLRGETDTTKLEEKGVNFWKGNTSREFLDDRGLDMLPAGDMGESYGWQLRNYGEPHPAIGGVPGNGLDQLKVAYETLKSDPFNRRVYVTLWNPLRSDMMALTPCWHSHQFVVLPNADGELVLHLKLINRSLDALFGCMFAVQQYALYQMCMAKLLGYKVGWLSCDLTHVHLYENQLEYTRELVGRETGNRCDVIIKKELNTIEDLLGLEWGDFEVAGHVVNQTPFKTPRPPMAV